MRLCRSVRHVLLIWFPADVCHISSAQPAGNALHTLQGTLAESLLSTLSSESLQKPTSLWDWPCRVALAYFSIILRFITGSVSYPVICNIIKWWKNILVFGLMFHWVHVPKHYKLFSKLYSLMYFLPAITLIRFIFETISCEFYMIGAQCQLWWVHFLYQGGGWDDRGLGEGGALEGL